MKQTSELNKLANIIKLDDLIFQKRLGSGQFGTVYMVKIHGNDQLFALKCVSKQMIVEQCLEKHLQVSLKIRYHLDLIILVAREKCLRSYKFSFYYGINKDI